ncbi:MAG: response regulator transcription factor [bacterium]|nr:response regulator transcription factor [bacterium]
MKKILIVEDDAAIATDLEVTLKSFEYDIAAIETSGEAAVLNVERYNPDLILMDIELPGEYNGIEAAKRIKKITDVPVVFLTSHAETTVIQSAQDSEPYAYLIKPCKKEELYATIQISLIRHEMERRLSESNRALEEEVERRKIAEKELMEYQENLEQMVEERTAELKEVNLKLQAEVDAHLKAQEEVVKLLVMGLSNKELECLNHMAEGLGRKEIAKEMDISVTTYDIHLRNIKKKLNIEEKNRIIKFAIEYRKYLSRN